MLFLCCACHGQKLSTGWRKGKSQNFIWEDKYSFLILTCIFKLSTTSYEVLDFRLLQHSRNNYHFSFFLCCLSQTHKLFVITMNFWVSVLGDKRDKKKLWLYFFFQLKTHQLFFISHILQRGKHSFNEYYIQGRRWTWKSV